MSQLNYFLELGWETWGIDPAENISGAGVGSFAISVLADMDASDTAHVVYLQSGGTAQTDLQGADGYSYFCGHLVA